ncbi:hypothetical protein L195_g047107 [Trifolium pratense]|uniref:Uncharacterized protein n=1 Tax=Trifolium pratense TaxID=57577 RepID=A0A2K3MJK1_TRIPR|nr:hypothetical protein L195_g047107 [Trifolium pratense]
MALESDRERGATVREGEVMSGGHGGGYCEIGRDGGCVVLLMLEVVEGLLKMVSSNGGVGDERGEVGDDDIGS